MVIVVVIGLILRFFIKSYVGCKLNPFAFSLAHSLTTYFSVNDRPMEQIRIASQRDSSPNRTVHSIRLIVMLPTLVGCRHRENIRLPCLHVALHLPVQVPVARVHQHSQLATNQIATVTWNLCSDIFTILFFSETKNRAYNSLLGPCSIANKLSMIPSTRIFPKEVSTCGMFGSVLKFS
jgi:hypothetical protein